ncbi:MAG: nucleotidyl transferase AbiEii/AbiGii toxin family protein [Candidatus Bathyarchaeota archaeon]
MLHDARFFNEESIKRKAAENGFSNNLAIELFLWDCEIAAQVQNLSQDLVLKGGAAVQLHLPVQMQRGSIDVDLVGNLTEDEVDDILDKVPENLPEVSFELYQPRSPVTRIPMVTYHANIPSLVVERRERGIQLKTEFLLEDLRLPSETIADAHTFALDVKNIRCYTVSSLIGDKLLTLAGTTIGVPREDDVPKQMYDVANLSMLHPLSGDEFRQIGETVEKLVPIEAGYREKQLEVSQVLEDIENSLEKYRFLGTSLVKPDTWRAVDGFQQFYVSSSQRRNRDEWSQRAWHLTFLTDLVRDTIQHRSAGQCASTYASVLEILEQLKGVSEDKVRNVKTELLKLAPPKTPGFRELKGKSLQRIFYQMVTRENIEAIQNLFSKT